MVEERDTDCDTVPHPAGLEALHGLLRNAAEAVGLERHGRDRVSLPVPIDVIDLVVRELRRLLADRRDEFATGVQVSTETAGPRRQPEVLAAAARRRGRPPVELARVQRASIRLTCWHRNLRTAKALPAVALELVCDVRA